MSNTTTAQIITGIPEASPFSVLNGRTGYVVEARTHGVVRFCLALPVSMEDARLAEVESIADLTVDLQHFEIDVLAKYLSDAPVVEPGREVPFSLINAAALEIGSAHRRAQRRQDVDGVARTQAEFWSMVRQFVTRTDLGNLIPESVATEEDARAWVYDYAARERFGF